MVWYSDQLIWQNKVGLQNLWQTSFFKILMKTLPYVCSMTTLRAYEERTESFRAKLPTDSKFQLFLSYIGQHTPVSSSTIARWLKCFMADAGIDISIFKARSITGASCSTAMGAGITTKDILDAADWSSEGTFQRFYCRELKKDD